ncbi:MAG: helical backbone metal receptor [Acidobacteriota bacterium]
MITRGFFSRFLFVLCCAPACLAPLNAQSVNRIVSTAPSITELLYALGLGDRVVGVDRFSRYPADAATKTKIGDYAAPNLETIASLRPDLVIIPVNPVNLKQRLEGLHLRVLEIDQDGIESLYKSFAQVGDATGVRPRADRLIASVRAGLESVRSQAAKLPPVRVMFVVGRNPQRLDGLRVVGQASYLSQIMQIAGGRNVFRDAPAGYPQVSLEEVLARNPEVIIDMGDMADTVGVTEAQKQSVAELWGARSTLTAVKLHHVYPVASDIFVQPGPRVVDAAREFFRMLHPEAALKVDVLQKGAATQKTKAVSK